MKNSRDDTILVRSTRDPLFGRTPGELEAALQRALSGRVNEAYFFGSFGTNVFGAESDIDIILINETDAPFLMRSREFEDLLDIHPALDILIYTPDEFERLTTDPSPGFWTSVSATLRRFYP